MRSALSLTAADRRWIDFLTQTINETWDDAHPDRPKTHGYLGSEEFIRLQFEEYLLALLSCWKYHEQISSQGTPGSPNFGPKSPGLQSQAMDIEGDPALDFNPEFLERWRTTTNFALFNRLTSDALLFSIVEPRHPCAGGLGIEDIQRRLAQQVSELHLDERMREGRDALNKHLATGQKKVTAAFNSLWTDLEAMREGQRKKNEEKALQQSTENRNSIEKELSPRPSMSSVRSPTTGSWGFAARKPAAPDLSQAQATVAAAGQRASAYFSSWGSWASERRKEWQEKKSNTNSNSPSVLSSPAGTPRDSTSFNNVSEVVSLSDLTSTGQQIPRTSTDAASGLSRSGSRKNRWSNMPRKHGSRDSVSSTKKSTAGEVEVPGAEPSSQQKDIILSPNDKEPCSLTAPDSITAPTIPKIEQGPWSSSSQLETYSDQEESPEAPTPTLRPSDRLQIHHYPGGEAAISPLMLDENSYHNVFADIDLTSSPNDSNVKATEPESEPEPKAEVAQKE